MFSDYRCTLPTEQHNTRKAVGKYRDANKTVAFTLTKSIHLSATPLDDGSAGRCEGLLNIMAHKPFHDNLRQKFSSLVRMYTQQPEV